MLRFASLALFMLAGCVTSTPCPSLEVTAASLGSAGILVETRLHGAHATPLVMPRVVIDPQHTEAALSLGEGDSPDTFVGAHALITIQGPEVLVEAWGEDHGQELWRCAQRVAVE